MEGRKFDGSKPKMHLLPPKAISEVAKVLTFGADKYGEFNWKLLENLHDRYNSAALRHIFANLDGEALDNESGYHHLAHAICCLLFRLEVVLNEQTSKEEGRGEFNTEFNSESNRFIATSGHVNFTYKQEGSV